MKFNVILDKAPGVYPGVLLNTDFKQVLKFFRVMSAADLTDKEKAELVYKLFILEMTGNPEEVAKAIELHVQGPDKPVESDGNKSFDFESM